MARKPLVNGTPGLGQQEHQHGHGQERPPASQTPDGAEIGASLARALDQTDHGEAPDDDEGVGEKVEQGARGPGLDAAWTPTST